MGLDSAPEAPDDAPQALHEGDDRLGEALALAYRYLNPRARTVLEVDQRLRREGLAPEVCRRALEVLAGQGYLDDLGFARAFAQEKRELDGWGSVRIRQRLIGRGVASDVADEALASGEGGAGGEGERALEVLRRRFPQPPRERRERDRALGVLLRKGFDSEVALDVLRRYAREAPPAPARR